MVSRVPKEALAKGQHGGTRPGAGRKPKSVLEQQECRRDTILRIVTDERWEKIVERAAILAQSGDPIARTWLTPYVAGKVPDAVMLTGADGGPLEVAVREIVVALPKRAAE